MNDMNAVKTMLGIALAVPLLVGCSDYEKHSGNPDFPEDNVVRVAAGVDDVRTRSLTTETLDGFYISIHNKVNSAYCYGYEPFRKVNGEWVSDRLLFWQNETQPVDIIAVRNVANIPLDAVLYEVKAWQELDEDQSEKSTFDKQDLLLYEAVDFVPGNGLVNGKLDIPFQHAYSLVYIRIILGTEYNVPFIPTFTPVESVKITGTYNCATVDFTEFPVAIELETEPLLDDFTKYDIKPYHERFSMAAATDEHSEDLYACILMPQTIKAGELKVKLEVDEDIYLWTSTADVTLESGMSYQIDIAAGKDAVASGNITSRAWTEASGGSSEKE